MEIKEAYSKLNEMNRNRYEVFLSKFLMSNICFTAENGQSYIRSLKDEYLNKAKGMLELMYQANVISYDEYTDHDDFNRLYANNKAHETFNKFLEQLY